MNKKIIISSKNSVANKNNFLPFRNFPLKFLNKNNFDNQYTDIINESIIFSNNEKDPENQLVVFFLHRAKKLYHFSKFKSIKQSCMEFTKLLSKSDDSELSQIMRILENGIKSNTFLECNSFIKGNAIINAMKGFDFLIYQGKSFDELYEEIKEVVRIFTNSIKNQKR